MPEVCRTVHPVERARLRSLVVNGNPGSRAVVFSIARVGLFEERPAVSGRREKTQREELQCQVDVNTPEGLVVKTVKILLVTSLGRCDDRLTAGVCTFRVIERGKSEAHRRMEASRAHVQIERHPEFHLECACMEEQPKIESRGCADSRRVSG